ncbi:hypothetical protein DPMN_116340 [Dreissena polymorpha]|uniref:HTH CENPB-type domain-containing protein n=1 Tax=Dreissena polymorpha TaxID=45954 RepID=A0A9D4QTB9_DREPO|nr:hypothetical protein DPMN_116340 [Dreissena polymorpha]
MGPSIAEIDSIVIREVRFQFEVNRCRNEEIIVKGNFGWAWPMWPGRPKIDHIVIREAQYQFEEEQTHITTISPLFLRNRPRWVLARHKYRDGNLQTKHPRKATEYDDLNDLVHKWFLDATGRQVNISGPLLKERALQFTSELGLASFKASNR